ncbi:Mg2 and Co2 transporter [Weissella confusa]|nr:Mg2 and Co2 transporter [Weissella confusa]MDA5459989.1 Mg2 and Co2 transporter [Weissella confusa]SJX68568.1 Magnesium and cobalt transport protein CorA [Weissella confusa]
MEYDEAADLTLMIFDVVTPTSPRATTEPVGMLFSNDQQRLYTFTREETDYVDSYLSGTEVSRRPLPDHATPLDVILNGTELLSSKFMSAILEINRRRTPIQSEIRKTKQTQKTIDQLMDLQTDLIYLLNSLHTDRDLLRSYKARHNIQLTDHQSERIDDVTVELQQAIDTGELSQLVTNRVSDAFVNLANSNLNWTMKLLTVSSIVLTVPNIVSGFFGQNVDLPFMHTHMGWIVTLIITFIMMTITTIVLWRSGFFRK